jgi:hypothetical protein
VTLILGVGQRLLPILGHTLLAWPRLVGPILFLIGFGNILRVTTEVAAVWWAPAFVVMPLSAGFEGAALLLFTANAVRTLWPRPDSLILTGEVTRTSRVATLLAEHPWIEDDLIDGGMDYVGRVRQVPGELTLGSCAASSGQDPDRIIERINRLLREHQNQE